jgi:putative phosphoesterase
MKVAVFADTHIPKRAKDLPPAAYNRLADVSAIIHAGDVIAQSFLDGLNRFAPVYAVLGNNDHDLKLPERLELCLEQVQIAVVHDSGPRKGRAQRLRKWFPEAQVVVFGHSHIPVNENSEGLLIFNPGSPTDRRRQPKHTMGILHISSGCVSAEVVELD